MSTNLFRSFVYKTFVAAVIVMLTLNTLPAYALNTAPTPPNSNSNSNFNANPQNAYASDNAYAVANAQGQSTRYFTTLGFGIPAGATIDGIVVSLEGNRTGGTGTFAFDYPSQSPSRFIRTALLQGRVHLQLHLPSMAGFAYQMVHTTSSSVGRHPFMTWLAIFSTTEPAIPSSISRSITQ